MKTRANSINWYTSIITLLFSAIAAWGIEVDLDAVNITEEIINNNWSYILSALLPSLITMSMKLWDKYKNKMLKFKELIKSPNFITQAITTVSLLLGSIGIIFGDAMPQAVSDAIFSGSTISLLTALVAHVLNPIWHFIKDKFAKDANVQ